MKKLLSVVLVISMLFSFAVPFTAAADEVTATEADSAFVKTNFPLSEANGANSKLFMLDGAPGDVVDDDTTNDYKDYVFGLDYTGYVGYDSTNAQYLYTGDFETDLANNAANNAALIYTIDKNPTKDSQTIVDLKTKDGGYFWNINGVDYQVNPLEKAIKIKSNVKTADTLTDEELKARFNSLNGVTLDVVDGYYKNVGILAASFALSRTGTSTKRSVKVQLVYKNGDKSTAETQTIDNSAFAESTTLYVSKGWIYGQKMNAVSGDNRSASAGMAYVPLTYTADPSQELDKIIITPTSRYTPVFVISAWGNGETVAEVLADYTSVTEVTADNYEEVKAALEKVNSILTETGYTSEDLGTEKVTYNTLSSALTAYEEALIEEKAEAIVKGERKTNFPISEANGANSKLFMADGTLGDIVDSDTSNDYKDYVFGLDYTGYVTYDSTNAQYLYTGNFETDLANTSTANNAALIYTVDKNPTSDSQTIVDLKNKDGGYFWNINGVDYQVNPLDKSIRIYSNVKTADTLTDETLKARFNSLNGVTLDVVNGYYKNVSILAASFALSATGNATKRSVDVQLVYKNGDKSTAETKTIDNSVFADSATKYVSKGWIYGQKMNATSSSGRSSSAGMGYVPLTYTANPSQELDKIIITPTSRYNPVFVISAWGNGETIEDALAKLDEIEVVSAESCANAKTAIADFDAFLERTGYTLKDLGSYKESYTNLVNEIADFEKNAEKNEVINNKYTQLEFVGPWDMFATDDDISDAKWKVTSTAAEPNILAFKGWRQVTYGNSQPSQYNTVAFKTAQIGSSAVVGNNGQYSITVGSVPFKLGAISTTTGVRGTNGWIPRGKLNISAYTEGGIPDIATTGDVTFQYGGSGYATNVMKGTFNINNSNISAINFLTTGAINNSPNRLYDVYVKYEGEDAEEHGYMFAGNLTKSVAESIYAITAEEYADIVGDDSLAASMKEFDLYTVDEINALRGYTPTTTVDTSKTITSANYTLDQLNEALGLELVNFPTNWIKDTYKDDSGTTVTNDTTINDIWKELVANTKYTAASSKAVALSTLDAEFDTTKLSSAYESAKVGIPVESAQFVSFGSSSSSNTDAFVSNTKYPLDPSRKVESVRVEANLTDIKGEYGIALASGGFYSLGDYNTGNGVMMLKYNGESVVNIKGTDYVLFMKVQRECGDSIFLGATYERKATIKEDVERINSAIAAINESTKVAEIIALRLEIEALKVETAFVTDSDFDLEALSAAEATLSARKIAEATAAMQAVTLSSTIEEANAAKDLYDYALLDENVTEASFDTALVALFNEIHAQIADRTNLKGVLNVRYFKGETPSADITIENATKFAGKPYKVVIAYYDENTNLLGTYIEDKFSVKDEKTTFTVTADKDFDGAVSVKGFIWKDFATLIPLASADETTKKDAFKVLSIGNSFSNNAHTYLAHIAADAGFEKVQIANLFIGGCSLETHAGNLSDTPAYTYQYRELNADGTIKSASLEEKVSMLYGIKAADWDVITIQQGSTYSGVADSYSPYLTQIIEYVNANKTNKNAKIAWHTTWAYLDGSDALAERYNGMTQIQMYNAIIGAVEEQVLPLATIDFEIPAGTAIQNLRATAMGDTFNSDDIHLNTTGCYVAGLTWFAKITGLSIDDITYTPNDTVKDNLDLIKTAVKNAIANPYEVTK